MTKDLNCDDILIFFNASLKVDILKRGEKNFECEKSSNQFDFNYFEFFIYYNQINQKLNIK